MYRGSALVNVDISRIEDARISLLDRGLLFGHGVFETLLVRDGLLINWEEHSLLFSAKERGLELD